MVKNYFYSDYKNQTELFLSYFIKSEILNPKEDYFKYRDNYRNKAYIKLNGFDFFKKIINKDNITISEIEEITNQYNLLYDSVERSVLNELGISN